MRWKAYSLGLSIFSLLGINWLASAAVANCIQADVSVQYNISGSKEPTERTNEVDLESDRACRGNASVTTGVQGNVGGNRRVRQTRRVRQRFTSADDGENHYSGKTVQIRSNATIDVYNPADNLDY